jgi:hypothetical protein
MENPSGGIMKVVLIPSQALGVPAQAQPLVWDLCIDCTNLAWAAVQSPVDDKAKVSADAIISEEGNDGGPDEEKPKIIDKKDE